MTPEPARERRTASRLVVAGFALALAAVWLIPGAAVNENRVLREFPALHPSNIASASAFAAIDGALVDHLPVKSTVVGGLGSALIGAGLSPVNTVFRGDGGEPFYSADFTLPCAREPQIPIFLDRVDKLAARWEGQGVRMLYAIAPDKSAIERDGLGPLGPSLLACSDRVRDTIAAGADDHLLVGWDDLSELRAKGDRLYIFGDTHWNWEGASAYSKLIVDRLSPGLFDDSAAERVGEQTHAGDLFTIMGETYTEPLQMLETVRTGVETTHESETISGFTVNRWTSTSTGADLIPGRTLILVDSFFGYNQSILPPYFESLTSVPLAIIDTPGGLVSTEGYDTVIIQQVQRNAFLVLDKVEAADWIAR